MPEKALSPFDVGSALRSLREARGISQRELARRAGMTNASLSQIEHGKVSPSISSLEKILRSIPMTLSAFFAGLTSATSAVISREQFTLQPVGNAVLQGFDAPVDQKTGLYFGRCTLEPGQCLQLDFLPGNQYAIGQVLTGTLHLQLGEVQHVLSCGDGFRFTPFHKHALSCGNESPAEIALTVHQSTS